MNLWLNLTEDKVIDTLKINRIFLAVVSLVIAAMSCASGKQPLNTSRTGYLENESIKEASGLAASRLRDDLLWVINDGGNAPQLYAVSTDGRDLGSVRVEGAENRDWEDLASFEYKGSAYLAIADVGDNAARHKTCTIYVVEEPVITDAHLSDDASVEPVWRITFRYEDGPRDSESIAIDLPNNRILLLSKRTMPPVLYGLQLFPFGNASGHVAERLTEVPNIQKGVTKHDLTGNLLDPNPYHTMPTAMDISPDGSLLAVLTYQRIYLFRRHDHQNWVSAIHRLPEVFALPRLSQAEALCFGPDGRTIFVTSEKRPAPLVRIVPDESSAN